MVQIDIDGLAETYCSFIFCFKTWFPNISLSDILVPLKVIILIHSIITFLNIFLTFWPFCDEWQSLKVPWWRNLSLPRFNFFWDWLTGRPSLSGSFAIRVGRSTVSKSDQAYASTYFLLLLLFASCPSPRSSSYGKPILQ